MDPINPFDPSSLKSPSGAAFYFTFADKDAGGLGRGAPARSSGSGRLFLTAVIIITLALRPLTNT